MFLCFTEGLSEDQINPKAVQRSQPCAFKGPLVAMVRVRLRALACKISRLLSVGLGHRTMADLS